MTRLALAFLWLLRIFPQKVIFHVGSAIGCVVFWLVPERRKVTRINLAKCFPHLPAAECERLARAHIRAFSQALMDHGILWWSRRERIERLVQLEGLEHLRAHLQKKGIPLYPVSAATGDGLPLLLEAAWKKLEEARTATHE
jgi:KDO2-lipid IV(A) lauroyltransferase